MLYCLESKQKSQFSKCLQFVFLLLLDFPWSFQKSSQQPLFVPDGDQMYLLLFSSNIFHFHERSSQKSFSFISSFFLRFSTTVWTFLLLFFLQFFTLFLRISYLNLTFRRLPLKSIGLPLRSLTMIQWRLGIPSPWGSISFPLSPLKRRGTDLIWGIWQTLQKLVRSLLSPNEAFFYLSLL